MCLLYIHVDTHVYAHVCAYVCTFVYTHVPAVPRRIGACPDTGGPFWSLTAPLTASSTAAILPKQMHVYIHMHMCIHACAYKRVSAHACAIATLCSTPHHTTLQAIHCDVVAFDEHCL